MLFSVCGLCPCLPIYHGEIHTGGPSPYRARRTSWAVRQIVRLRTDREYEVHVEGQSMVDPDHDGREQGPDPGALVGHLLRRCHQVHNVLWSEEVGSTLTPSQYSLLATLAAADAGLDQNTIGLRAGLTAPPRPGSSDISRTRAGSDRSGTPGTADARSSR